MKNKNFGRKRQAIYISSNRKSTRIIKTLMDFFFFIKVKIKMVCFSVPSVKAPGGGLLRSFEHISSFCLLALYYMQFLFAICIIYFCGLQVFTMISPPTGLYGNSLSNFLTARSMFFLISSSSDISCIVSLLKY